MAVEPDNYLINTVPYIEKRFFGKKTKVLKRTGAIRTKYSIEVKAETLAVAASALNMGDELARIYMEHLSKRIKEAGEVNVKLATQERRKAWGSSPSSPSAVFRFEGPKKKLSKKQVNENILLPPKDRHRRELKKGAMPDTPPDPNATGWLNHSGRLREGLSMIKKGARGSESKEHAVWTIFVAHNRLHENSWFKGKHDFQWFLKQFAERVRQDTIVNESSYKAELRNLNTRMILRLQKSIAEKRRHLLLSGAKMAGRFVVQTIAFGA